MRVSYGIRIVLRTALFHSIFICRAILVFKSQVWHPYQAQQYVWKSLPRVVQDILLNLLFSVFTWDIKMCFFAFISWESQRSWEITLPRWFTWLFHWIGMPSSFSYQWVLFYQWKEVTSGFYWATKGRHLLFTSMKKMVVYQKTFIYTTELCFEKVGGGICPPPRPVLKVEGA